MPPSAPSLPRTAHPVNSATIGPVIYDHPQAYELACSFRDVSAEVDALRRWADGARDVLELAAGPAEHAR